MYTGQILRSATPDFNTVMLLQIVPFAGNMRNHLQTIGQSNSTTFTIGRIGLSRLSDERLQHDA